MDAATAVTRRGFVAGVGAGALALAVPARAAGGRDAAILNALLAIEHAQAAFYGEVERTGALGSAALEAARVLGAVERAHVATLTAALGEQALAPPSWAFRNPPAGEVDFLRTAAALEDLGTAIYAGQIVRLVSSRHLETVAAIHTVEAGHSAWVRLLAGAPPVIDALDAPIADAEATALLREGGLRERFPLTAAQPSPATPAVGTEGEGPRDLPWSEIATAGALCTGLVLGVVGLRMHAARSITIVGADEGPPVSQRVAGSAPDEDPR